MPDRNGVVLRLACLTAFTVVVDIEAADALMDALRTGDIGAVLAHHDQRGRVLLGVRPHPLPGAPAAVELAPMELELHLSPRHSVRLVFSRSRAHELLQHLADARDVLSRVAGRRQ
ncbi:hypothetical protein GTS_28490 [Gandjariella thermophila]|uniref:Uncharacterized protein n=2 Tax=Gandjariella thermophila TaxID=1931992 RepID=A0A4D4J9P9_9PSEU|nr:hypothetical protein GTS_28490 [Gandjariella thermophila]